MSITNMKSYKVIISGGGTGGHIFPAISIANTLKKRFPDIDILFVGAEDRMEMSKVPAAGYPIVGLPVKGFDRAHLFKNIEVVRCLLKSLSRAKKTLRDFRPDIAVGVGGYASGPTLWMADLDTGTKLVCRRNQQIISQESRTHLCGLRRHGEILPERENRDYRQSGASGPGRGFRETGRGIAFLWSLTGEKDPFGSRREFGRTHHQP